MSQKIDANKQMKHKLVNICRLNVSISAYKSFNLAGIPLFTNISIPFTLQKPDLILLKFQSSIIILIFGFNSSRTLIFSIILIKTSENV